MSFERSDAPGELRKIELFCNSAKFRSAEDALITQASAALWLRAHDMETGSPSRKEHEQLVTFRETVRDFLGGRATGNAVATLNKFAKSTLSGAQWTPEGEPVLPPKRATGTEALIGSLLAILFAAGQTGELDRLKTCHNPECRYVFYDRSPSKNGVWCSTDFCGEKPQPRPHRARHIR
ncbi:hypothetical protein BAY61_23070 [Prauserella marina]|uniref:Conserved protein containing a Zn-ribbon-like motif, possibly RNA-binding n=1 Tax=Prauserella marina TaxID=530584 RepID=A0A222VTY8_9PSEU|nr:CGNR zinc finger domain-containing protein [Prauserella marina]ASR37406.1 hypothetical protein BAY61_23070 [Prauserella marina]PWV74718.1 putative RNA-binding Zn ribbon-like protein [Prauserella marina]SDD42521.1 Conserved protein containing a Zn-ribbon-like motif, possibly RNA-binding [Prauserella marina]